MIIALAIVDTSAALAQESTTSYDTTAPNLSAGTQPKDHSSMQGIGHGLMQGMDHGSTQGTDHDSMQDMDHGPMQGMDHGSMQGTDHGSTQGTDRGPMQMQGGSPPPDARDPNTYPGGYQLGVEKYALGNTRQLMMIGEHNFGSLLIDRLEWARGTDSNTVSYEAQAWYGNIYNKVVLKAEGNAEKGRSEEAYTELLWGRAITTFWDTQLGIRNDAGSGHPAQNWVAFGVQGLTSYWFSIQATAYVGNSSHTALRLSMEYELLLIQRLILQLRVEVDLYGRNDPVLEISSGLPSASVGLRLRCKFSWQFTPYTGVERYQMFGNTANMIRADGSRSGETRFVAGLRVWYQSFSFLPPVEVLIC